MSTSLHTHTHDSDSRFNLLRDAVAATFKHYLDAGHKHLFTTDVSGLWDAYLNSFSDPVERQHHNCHECRRFIEKYFGLVVINELGNTWPAFIPTPETAIVPVEYAASINNIFKRVCAAKVTGVFISNEKRWGIPKTGDWTHFSVTPPKSMIFDSKVKTPFQAMAEARENYAMLMRACADFKDGTISAAISMVNSGVLDRSDKFKGHLEWFRDAKGTISQRGRQGRNKAWLAVASAPAGWRNVRSGVIGSLLEDLQDKDLSNEDVKRRFNAKLDPLKYQRPEKTSEGNLDAAEKLIAKLGLQNSLRRRFARLEDMRPIWTPTKGQPETSEGGVFGALRKSAKNEGIAIGAQTMTWGKFSSKFLNNAAKIEFETNRTPGNYCGVLTAADPDAPPIIRWDSPENRNPVSWYVYSGGSHPHQWGLSTETWVEVTGISRLPCDRDLPQGVFNLQFADGVILHLASARDQRNRSAGLFPEILISELHPIRATMEAFSRANPAEGDDEATANGYMLSGGKRYSMCRLRVTDKSGNTLLVTIDRWD